MKKTNDTMKNLLGLNEEFVLDLDTQNENFSLNEDEDEDESAKDQPKKDQMKSLVKVRMRVLKVLKNLIKPIQKKVMTKALKTISTSQMLDLQS